MSSPQMPGVSRVSRKSARRSRGGSNALEFGLTMPVLIVMIMGLIDYGWFFLSQALIVNALREAVRYGSLQTPSDTDDSGECTRCISETATQAVYLLSKYNVDVSKADVTPTIIGISGTCALSLQPDIPFTPIVGLVTTPTQFDVDTVMFLQNVEGC